jgi:hypothetical protein
MVEHACQAPSAIPAKGSRGASQTTSITSSSSSSSSCRFPSCSSPCHPASASAGCAAACPTAPVRVQRQRGQQAAGSVPAMGQRHHRRSRHYRCLYHCLPAAVVQQRLWWSRSPAGTASRVRVLPVLQGRAHLRSREGHNRHVGIERCWN